ncbi:hypothetical protein M0638_17470 [Roseomonas sp. NAR14]|uniref:Uncharacterized protein n=1 Tax=Roseomonas acroporae TaxID=2937791 RepID=A0A9X1Y9S8_9PROT|nr:hypothetical protein [Roseomonas acroporae]MCK8786168.1 hypothetical protein [Roseomonas acroporae]
MPKAEALALVSDFAAATGRSAWPKLDRAKLAAGLTERIDDPNRIHQRQTPLCGPCTLFRAVAITDPEAYARAAIDLFNNGSATIGKLKLRPGSELLASAPGGNTDTADWITLATLRDTDNWFLSPAGLLGGNVAGITRPGTLKSWLRDVGFGQIRDETYLAVASKPIPTALAAGIGTAGTLHVAGWFVALFIDSEMIESNSDATALIPNHWVTLTSPIVDKGVVSYDGPISLTVYSWGKGAMPVLCQTKRSFMDKYFGYVAFRR